mgnify:CR=1 FL=1
MKTLVMTVMALMVATAGIAGDYGVKFSCVVAGNDDGFDAKAINNGPHNLKCRAKVETVPTSQTFKVPLDGGWAGISKKEQKDVLQSVDGKAGLSAKITSCTVIEPECELQ